MGEDRLDLKQCERIAQALVPTSAERDVREGLLVLELRRPVAVRAKPGRVLEDRVDAAFPDEDLTEVSKIGDLAELVRRA